MLGEALVRGAAAERWSALCEVSELVGDGYWLHCDPDGPIEVSKSTRSCGYLWTVSTTDVNAALAALCRLAEQTRYSS
jgi:hypothetical protein